MFQTKNKNNANKFLGWQYKYEPTFPKFAKFKDTGRKDVWSPLAAIVLRSIHRGKTVFKLCRDKRTCINQHPASLEPELNFIGVKTDSGVGQENQSSITQTNCSVMALARKSMGWWTITNGALQIVGVPKMRELQRNILDLQKYVDISRI